MPAMSEVTGSLGKKVGPLKVWHYGLILGGGYLLYRVMKGKGLSLTGSTATTTDTSALPDTSAYTGPGSAYVISEGGGTGGSAPTPTPTTTPAVPLSREQKLAAFYNRYITKEASLGNTYAAGMSYEKWYETKFLAGALEGKYQSYGGTTGATPAQLSAASKALAAYKNKSVALPTTSEALKANGNQGRSTGKKAPATRRVGTTGTHIASKAVESSAKRGVRSNG